MTRVPSLGVGARILVGPIGAAPSDFDYADLAVDPFGDLAVDPGADLAVAAPPVWAGTTAQTTLVVLGEEP